MRYLTRSTVQFAVAACGIPTLLPVPVHAQASPPPQPPTGPTPDAAGGGTAAPNETVLPTVKVRARLPLFETAPETPGFKATRQDSATKSDLPIRETPQAISVITRESIDARQARDINSALELAAGVTTAGSMFAGHTPRSGENMTLRGQELDSSRDLRIDGFASGTAQNNIDLAPFERVEVIKGPSSMLYGQGSLGGFINMVRKKPQADTGVRAAVTAGSFDTKRVDVDVTGSLTSDDSVTGLVTLAYEDSGSFVDGVHSKRAVIAPTIEARFGSATRAALSVIYQGDKFTPSLGIALKRQGNELVPPDVPRSFYFGRPPIEESTADALHTSLRVDHELSNRWLATLVLHNSRNRLMGIADSYGYGLFTDEVTGTKGWTNLYSSWVAHDNRNWAGELRLDGRFDAAGREHRVLVGLEVNRQKYLAWGGGGYPAIGTGNIYEGFANAPFVPGASNPQSYDYDYGKSAQAAYGQVMLSVADRAKLLLGARYDRAKQHSEDVFYAQPRAEKADNASTFRVGATYDFLPMLTGYANYAQSFNPILDLSRSGILDPERGQGYEVGLKAEPFDKRMLATVGVFSQELNNRAIPDPTNKPNESFVIAGGLQRTKGVELELQGSPIQGLTLGVAATFLDAEYIDRNDPNFGLTPGGIVKRQAGFFIGYEFRSGPLPGLGVNATLVDVGDRIVMKNAGSVDAVNLIVPGYRRLDLGLSYSGWSKWTLALNVRNVTDETYIEQPNSAYDYAHFFGAPRAWQLRAEYRY